MSAQWTEGYFTDAAYTHGYYREMSPAHLRFCLLQKGFLPPPAAGFNYCELAMGNGYSANILAAANSGHFCGMDFNPDHAAFAADLAGRGQSDLRVSDDSFEEFLEREHPQYDYVCLHGGWSWVSGRSHGLIVEFLKRHLKLGGVFYLSYNCHPGWAAAAPLRELLTLFGRHGGKGGDARNSIEQVKNAVAMTGEFLQAGPLYLNGAEWIKEKFEALRQESPEYLAHEFFNADWHVVYFREVAAALAEAKLRFGASAYPQNNIPGFGLTREAAGFLEGIADPVLYQQLWDFFCNSPFRADIFIKGAVELSTAEQTELLQEQYFALIADPANIDYVMNSGMASFQLDEAGHGSVVAVLAEDGFRPKTLRHIHEQLKNKLSFRQALDILIRLIGKGYVDACAAGQAADTNVERCKAFNGEIIRRTEFSTGLRYLASPRTGGGVAVSRIDMLFIQAARKGVEPVGYVLKMLEDNGEKLTHKGQTVEDNAQAQAVLNECLEVFNSTHLVLWKGLGVLD